MWSVVLRMKDLTYLLLHFLNQLAEMQSQTDGNGEVGFATDEVDYGVHDLVTG